MSRLILASASPQRNTLLAGLCAEFGVVPSIVDESVCAETDPAARAQVLACLKARDVHARNPGAHVIGCDTLVVSADGALHEKPADEAAARSMLASQSGRTCTVHSGLCVVAPDGTEQTGLSTSRVTFKDLSDADIDWWISTGEWRDRSGSFQIDGRGQLMIKHLDGDWTSVVGLPVFLLGQLLEQAGYPLR
jgi:septum formation protein